MKSILLRSTIVVFGLTASNVRADLLLAAFSADAVYRYNGLTSTVFASSSLMGSNHQPID